MSTNCKKIEEYLVDYLYQELAAKKTLEVEKHLRACSHCSQTLESWRAIHRAYQRSTEEPQVAPYTKQKILAVAEEELHRSPSWNEKLLWGLKIATVPIAIFILVLFLNTKKEPEIAMTKPVPAAPEQAVEIGKERAEPSVQRPVIEERQQQLSDRELKTKTDVQAYSEQISPRRNEARSDKDQMPSMGYAAEKEAAPSAAPSAAAPPPVAESTLDRATGMESDPVVIQQAAPGQRLSGTDAISKKAEEPFQKAQDEFRNKNVKEGQSLLRQAISYDDQKSLASKLHEQGNTYQAQGEYGIAIAQYENVQNNYKDYARMDDVLIRLGDSYAEIGEFNKAVNAYRQVSPTQRKIAIERIQRLQKKQEAQEQLKSLGYVSEPEKKD